MYLIHNISHYDTHISVNLSSQFIVGPPSQQEDYAISASSLRTQGRNCNAFSFHWGEFSSICEDPIMCMKTILYVCTRLGVALANLQSSQASGRIGLLVAIFNCRGSLFKVLFMHIFYSSVFHPHPTPDHRPSATISNRVPPPSNCLQFVFVHILFNAVSNFLLRAFLVFCLQPCRCLKNLLAVLLTGFLKMLYSVLTFSFTSQEKFVQFISDSALLFLSYSILILVNRCLLFITNCFCHSSWYLIHIVQY